MAKTSLLILALILSMSCSEPTKDAPGSTETALKVQETKTTPIKILEIIPKEFIEIGEYYGNTSGLEEATLLSIMGGRVESLLVIEGQKVKAGDSLGRVNSPSALATYELAQLNERISRQNYERQKSFFAQGNTSQLTLDQSQLVWLTSKTSLLDAQKVKDGALCISPISGTVVQSFIKVNQELTPRSPTFSVARTDKLIINFGIPERDMSGVSLGNSAEVSFGIFPGQTWQGKLIRLSKELNPSNRTFTAEVEINNAGGELLVGLTAEVKLVRNILTNQIVIPSATILSSGNSSYVMIEVDGVAKKVPVVTGSSTKNTTRLVSGPEFGSRLITEGNHLITDGSLVRIIGDSNQ